MRESKIEDYLKSEVKKLGGETRKVSWIARRHAPDELVMLTEQGVHFYAETKRDDLTKPFPATKREERQHAEHERMRAAGMTVMVISSRKEVDAVLRMFTLLGRPRGGVTPPAISSAISRGGQCAGFRWSYL